VERQDRDGRLVWKRKSRQSRFNRSSGCCRVGDPNSKDSYWPRNVFEALIPEVIKGQIEAVTDMVADRA